MSLDFTKLMMPNQEPKDPVIKTEVSYKVLEKEQADRQREKRYYERLIEGFGKSENIRGDILKGAKAGEAPETLLLKAIECIALLTNDETFKKSFFRNYKAGQ